MRAEEIRELSETDIRARIAELDEERFRLGFRSATEPLEDPLRLRVIRRGWLTGAENPATQMSALALPS